MQISESVQSNQHQAEPAGSATTSAKWVERLGPWAFGLGIVAEVTTIITFGLSLSEHRLLFMCLATIGWLLILGFGIYSVFKRVPTLPNPSDSEVEQVNMKKFAFSGKMRLLNGGVALAATAGFVILSFNFLKSVPDAMAEPPGYPRKPKVTKLLKINEANWIGSGDYARVTRGDQVEDINYAEIFDKTDTQTMGQLEGNACALQIDVQTADNIPWVTIEGFAVVVSHYEPLPPYKLRRAAPFEEAPLYYVEIDDPAVANTDTFHTEFVVEDGRRMGLGVTRVVKDTPRQLFVRINARRPGIYKLEVMLLAEYGEENRPIVLTSKPTRWLFDGGRQ